MFPEHPRQSTPARRCVNPTGHSWANPEPVSKLLDLRLLRTRQAPAFINVQNWIGALHRKKRNRSMTGELGQCLGMIPEHPASGGGRMYPDDRLPPRM